MNATKFLRFPKNGLRMSNGVLSAPRASMSMYVNHKDTAGNNDRSPFEFTKENYALIEKVLAKYPSNYKKSGIIPLLTIAQKQAGNFLSLAAMNKVAKVLEVPPMAVYSVASFYTMFNREPVGKFHLQICGTTPCMVRGAQDVIKAASEYAGVAAGHGVSNDGLFCISEVECLGACVNAPMLQLNNEKFYEDLTPESTVELMKKWKNGEDPKEGPQTTKRVNSEGPLGRSTLKDFKPVNHDRDFAGAKKQWEDKKAEAAKK
eukprot:CAMPEP_0114979762 /NCGR_PEP_ID=MMETSP0216-20121206/4568_1 /TAXON_ID=223996 /ORGANISM="Protocruzia adherens, Strain Boccale" /LENGTH=260 /DNA_ID=CAMNT_0002341157 /DNA_START=27 /DNA_END=809 /DNA_ORIENTATION=-